MITTTAMILSFYYKKSPTSPIWIRLVKNVCIECKIDEGSSLAHAILGGTTQPFHENS